MGKYRLGPPEDFVIYIREQSEIEIFVETGTWKAATTVWAAKHFTKVITIDADEKRYRRAIARNEKKHPNIEWVYGDSKKELALILDKLFEPVIFWLDAHAPATHNLGASECPLLDELIAINAHLFSADHVILIDDVRFLQGDIPDPWNANAWPTLAEVRRELKKHERITAIHEDVLFAWPARWDYVARQFLATM